MTTFLKELHITENDFNDNNEQCEKVICIDVYMWC